MYASSKSADLCGQYTGSIYTVNITNLNLKQNIVSKLVVLFFMQIKSVLFKVFMIQGHMVEVSYDRNIAAHLLLNVPSMSIPFHFQNGIICFSEFYWVASTAFF